jgi:hypothetical protein
MTTINLPSPFALDLERHISVPEAAKFKNISPDTFRRHYAHLIRKISPRRNAVKVRDLLATDATTQKPPLGRGGFRVS